MILRWGPGINNDFDMCSTAIFLCLACYISTKVSCTLSYWREYGTELITAAGGT